MAGRLIRIAAAQYPLDRLASLADYQVKAERWIGEAAARGAHVAALPEYGGMELAALGGDAVAADLQGSLAAAADAAPPMLETYRRLARRHAITVLTPSTPERRGTSFVNAAHVVAPSGRSAVVEKAIMTPFELAWGVCAGGALPVVDTPLARIGIAICYDSEFPLLVRALAEAGARLILVPSCTERVTGWSRVRTAAMARALESQVLVATSPTVGTAEWSPAVDVNTGAAGVFAPADRGVSDHGVIAEGELNRPGFVRAVLDFPPVMAVRHEGEVRTFEDWPAQPGAAALSGKVKIVDLD